MTQTEDAKLVRIGFIVSITVHLFLALLAAWWVTTKQGTGEVAAKPKPAPKVQLVFSKNIQVAPVKVLPTPSATERYVRTSSSQAETAAPANAEFVSDRNTVASTTLPSQADGAPGLPTTRGIKDLPVAELKNREYIEGEMPIDTAPPSPNLATTPEEKAKSKSVEKPPEPKPQDANTRTLAMATPPAENLLSEPVPPKAKPVLDPPVLRDPSTDSKAFQPHTRTADRDGNVNNPGLENAVNARATPRGKYMQLVTSQIEKRWHFLRSKRADFVEPGKLRLRFYVSPNGKVRPQDIFIVSSNANPVLTDFSIQAIMEADIPPIPEELLSQLEQDRVEIEYDIVIY